MGRRRRADGEGSITWDASVQLWIGRLPRDERGRRPKVTGRTEQETRRKLQQRLRERELGHTGEGHRTTVQAFLERWISDTVRSSDLSPRTIENYERMVRLHLVPGLAD